MRQPHPQLQTKPKAYRACLIFLCPFEKGTSMGRLRTWPATLPRATSSARVRTRPYRGKPRFLGQKKGSVNPVCGHRLNREHRRQRKILPRQWAGDSSSAHPTNNSLRRIRAAEAFFYLNLLQLPYEHQTVSSK